MTESSTRRGPFRAAVPLALVILVLALVLARELWLPLLARVLIVDQPPSHADAILVLGGGDGSRQDRAIELYQQGYAPLLISSGESPLLPDFDASFAVLGADYMVARGVPREAILLMEQTTSTQEEAAQSLQLAREQGLTSLLVVTDHYHTRRSWLTFRRAYRDSGIAVSMAAATPQWFDAAHWWQSERSLLAVIEEYEKLVYYLLRGYIP